MLKEIPKMEQDKTVYSDSTGKMIGREQSNNAVVLYTGLNGAEHVEDMDMVSFPKEAIPNLIEFLKSCMHDVRPK